MGYFRGCYGATPLFNNGDLGNVKPGGWKMGQLQLPILVLLLVLVVLSLLWYGCLRGSASCYSVVGEVLGVVARDIGVTAGVVSDDVAGVVTGAVAVCLAVVQVLQPDRPAGRRIRTTEVRLKETHSSTKAASSGHDAIHTHTHTCTLDDTPHLSSV